MIWLTLSTILGRIKVMNGFINTLKYFLLITAELTVIFLGISTIVALILMYIQREKLKQWLSRRGLWGNFLGAAFGSLTPFCACSTIPMTLGLLNAGVPFGPVMSFVISSPLLNPIIVGMIFALMGIKACLLYFSVTFLGSILFGYLLEKVGGTKYVKNVRIKAGCCGNGHSEENIVPTNFKGKIKASFLFAWGDFRAVLIYLLIGVGIGAGIYGYMSLGAVIALIIGGAGMAIPEMVMLASIFKKRLVIAMVSIIWVTAVVGGYVFNTLL